MNRPIGRALARVVRPLAVGAMLAAVTLSAAVAEERAIDVVRSDTGAGFGGRALSPSTETL